MPVLCILCKNQITQGILKRFQNTGEVFSPLPLLRQPPPLPMDFTIHLHFSFDLFIYSFFHKRNRFYLVQFAQKRKNLQQNRKPLL